MFLQIETYCKSKRGKWNYLPYSLRQHYGILLRMCAKIFQEVLNISGVRQIELFAKAIS